jgi:hypothetical protein
MTAAVLRPIRPLRGGRTIVVLALLGVVAAGAAVGVVRWRGDDAPPLTAKATPLAGEVASGGATAAGGVATDAGSTAASAAPSVLPRLERVVRRGEIRLRVSGDVPAATDRVAALATTLGGFVADSATSSSGRRATAELTLRVPAARFDEARRRLAALGRVEGSSLSGEDVSGQLVDLDARLRTLRTEEGALDALLGKARDIPQILQVRDRLTAVRTEIEQLAGQQAVLQDQAALSTIHVSLHRAGARPATTRHRDGLGDSLRTAGDVALAVVGGMAITVGALLPLLLVAGLLLLFVRRLRRGGTNRPVPGGGT